MATRRTPCIASYSWYNDEQPVVHVGTGWRSDLARTTIGQIARSLNVSKSTVSRVMNNAPGTRVSDSTRQRIMAACREQGYRPSFSAQALATGRTRLLGVHVQSLNDDYYGDFFRHFDDACYPHGYTVLFSSSQYDRDRERRNLEAFLSGQMDAVLVTRTPKQHEDLLRRIIQRGVHVILMGEMPTTRFPLVTIDEFEVGRLAAQHLWSQGHRRVMYLAAEKASDQSGQIHFHRRENFLGPWEQISRGLPLRQFTVGDGLSGALDAAEFVSSLAADQRPTAIACGTDRLALSMLSALRARKLAVPDDISVIGCDDITAAAEAAVPLTTIRQPRDRLAQAAWQMLKERLDAGEPAAEEVDPPQVLVPPELIVRKSTKRVTN